MLSKLIYWIIDECAQMSYNIGFRVAGGLGPFAIAHKTDRGKNTIYFFEDDRKIIETGSQLAASAINFNSLSFSH